MSVPEEVLRVLRERLLTIPTLPAERQWQGVVADTTISNQTAYVRDAVQVGTREALELAPRGQPRWWRWSGGLYQVTLHYPADSGMHAPIAMAQAVADAFQGSSLVTTGGTTVRVDSVRVGPAVPDQTGHDVPIQIRFTFDTHE
jgi:surface antigen